MAKKDTTATVLGMLSSTGASTRPLGGVSRPEPAEPAEPSPVDERASTEQAVPDVAATSAPDASPTPTALRPTSSAPTRSSRRRSAVAEPETTARDVPRTLRLRASTAAALRDAWLEAKRDDVLLSHQDFASNLIDDALGRRRGSRR